MIIEGEIMCETDAWFRDISYDVSTLMKLGLKQK